MELYINDILLDLDKSVPFPLTYHIADIKEPDKRKGSNSKTIALPGTRRNCEILNTVFALTTTDPEGQTGTLANFDPSIKATARYYQNGILQFEGICQLVDCVLQNGSWTFNIVLISDEMDIFTLLKNLKVKDLGWSEYNHAYTKANQENSWTGVIQKNGVPYNNYSGTDWLGEGYYYGLIDYGYDRPADNTFEVNHIPPQVFLKSIVDKMFTAIDVSYTSNFFDSQRFKKCLMAYEGGELPEIDSTLATAQSIETDHLNDATSGFIMQDTDQLFTPYNSNAWVIGNQSNYISYNSNSGTAVDPGSQIQSHVPFMFVTEYEGVYNFSYSGDHDWNFDFTVTGGSGTINYNGRVECYILIKRNGSLNTIAKIYENEISSTTATNSFTASFNYSGDITFYPSDVIEVEFRFLHRGDVQEDTPQATAVQLDVDVTATTCQLDLTYQQQTIQPGSTINIRQFLPDMDCATFFKGLITMFNLYVRQDPDDVRKLVIEPLNTFYNGSNNALDWTGLVDYSKEFRVTPTVNIATKEYIFEWHDDKDYWNERYFNDVTEQYGGKTLVNGSQFATGQTKYKLPFSQKLLGEIPNTDLIVPRNFIVKADGNGNTEITPKKGKPFIVQIKKGNVGTLQTASWVHINENDSPYNESAYGYVGHLDSLDSPSFDLNFDIPSYVFYELPAGQTYTTNNLYTYHEKFLRELVDRNAKMLTCYIQLDANIINSLDFGDLINIDGVVYRLQKIDNYDPLANTSTKVELIRLIEGDSIQTYTVSMDFDPYEVPALKKIRVTEDTVTRETEDGADLRITE